MARGFGAREAGVNAFRSVLSGLSEQQRKEVSDKIFLTTEGARKAKFAGYNGPSSKNSFAWFTPEAEKEVFAKATQWAAKQKDLLGAIWDASRMEQTPGGVIRGLPRGFLDYPDKQTFIDRHTRFLGDYYKSMFEQPISKALGTVFAGKSDDFSKKERASKSFGSSPALDEAMGKWNEMLDRSEKEIRQDSLDWLKTKV